VNTLLGIVAMTTIVVLAGCVVATVKISVGILEFLEGSWCNDCDVDRNNECDNHIRRK
jgi:hypothetical protein